VPLKVKNYEEKDGKWWHIPTKKTEVNCLGLLQLG
jgi:hypothetical protein